MTEAGTKNAAGLEGRLTASQVEEYLRENPDFLAKHAQLISLLEPPARKFGSGKVADLQQYMLSRQRDQIVTLGRQHQALLKTSRTNQRTQSRVHKGVLAVMRARTLEHLIEVVTTDLAVILDLDVVTLCIESGKVPRVAVHGVRVLPDGLVDQLVGGDGRLELADNVVGDKRVYGSAAGLVRSQALLRLRVRREPPHALLAFGSRDPKHFSAGQGTELLSFLARVIEQAIREWLDFRD